MIAVFGANGFTLGQELDGVFAVGITTEVIVHRSCRRNRVKGRISDNTTDLTPNHLVLAPLYLCPLHTSWTIFRVKMAGEGINCLVVMVIAIEGHKIQFRGHVLMVRQNDQMRLSYVHGERIFRVSTGAETCGCCSP